MYYISSLRNNSNTFSSAAIFVLPSYRGWNDNIDACGRKDDKYNYMCWVALSKPEDTENVEHLLGNTSIYGPEHCLMSDQGTAIKSGIAVERMYCC